MKIRNYERVSIMYFMVILVLLLEGIGILVIQNIKVRKYNLYSTIITENNERLILTDKSNKKIIYKNTFLYLENKKIKYKIKEDKKIDNNLYEIHLSFSSDKKYSKKDIVVVAIEKQKTPIFEVLKNGWGGD